MATYTYTFEFNPSTLDGSVGEPDVRVFSRKQDLGLMLHPGIAKVTLVHEYRSGGKTKQDRTVEYTSKAREQFDTVTHDFKYAGFALAHAHTRLCSNTAEIAKDLRKLADRLEYEAARVQFVNPERLTNPNADPMDRDWEYSSVTGQLGNGYLHTLNWGVANLSAESVVGKAVEVDAKILHYRRCREALVDAKLNPDEFEHEASAAFIAAQQAIIDSKRHGGKRCLRTRHATTPPNTTADDHHIRTQGPPSLRPLG